MRALIAGDARHCPVPVHLPVEARRRLLSEARAALEDWPTCSKPTIALAEQQWRAALDDAEVHRPHLLRDHIYALSEASTIASGAQLRIAANAFATRALLLAENVSCLGAFSPSSGHANSLLTALRLTVEASLAAAERGQLRATTAAPEQLVETARQALVLVKDGMCETPLTEALRVPSSELSDSRGIFSPTRVLAAYYGRYEELAARIRSVLSVVTDDVPEPVKALPLVEALVSSSRPLLVLRACRGVQRLLAEEIANDPDRVAAILRKLKLRVDRSAANHAGMIQTATLLTSAEAAADRAGLTLDLYRKTAEGQLRPWAAALLRIRGCEFSATPELSQLRDQLLADGDPLLHDAAVGILPVARNAAAHEDYAWDDDHEVLMVGGSTITPAELEDATDRAYAFMCGAEVAWAIQRESSPAFAELLDAEDPPSGLRVVAERAAIAHFGTNGLHVQAYRHERGSFAVVLDDLPPERINPCFQAVMWMSWHLNGTDRFRVFIQERADPVIDLSRDALDATFLVWRRAIASFSAMPQSTFLPANTVARLAVESPFDAGCAAAWLAVNDALDAYIDAREGAVPLLPRLAALAGRLDVAAVAISATLQVVPLEACQPLAQAHDALIAAARWAGAGSRGASIAIAGASFEHRLWSLYDSWPVPAILPTLDRRSLSDSV